MGNFKIYEFIAFHLFTDEDLNGILYPLYFCKLAINCFETKVYFLFHV